MKNTRTEKKKKGKSKGLHMALDMIRPLCGALALSRWHNIISGVGEIKSILTSVVTALQAAISKDEMQ